MMNVQSRRKPGTTSWGGKAKWVLPDEDIDPNAAKRLVRNVQKSYYKGKSLTMPTPPPPSLEYNQEEMKRAKRGDCELPVMVFDAAVATMREHFLNLLSSTKTVSATPMCPRCAELFIQPIQTTQCYALLTNHELLSAESCRSQSEQCPVGMIKLFSGDHMIHLFII